MYCREGITCAHENKWFAQKFFSAVEWQNYMPVESFLCAKSIGAINPMVKLIYTRSIGDSMT